MSEKQRLLRKIKTEYRWVNVVLLCIGGGLIILGVNRFIYGKIEFGVNARYLQPVVISGGLPLLVGTILLLCLVYRVIKRNNVMKQQLEIDEEERLEFRRRTGRK